MIEEVKKLAQQYGIIDVIAEVWWKRASKEAKAMGKVSDKDYCIETFKIIAEIDENEQFSESFLTNNKKMQEVIKMEKYKKLFNEARFNPNDVIIYDNGGKTADRYTIFMSDGAVYSMSDMPSHPQGFNQYAGDVSEISKGSHLGREISFKRLPKDVQIAIAERGI